LPFPAARLGRRPCPKIELRIIKQRKVDLVAHRGNVGLVKEELGSMAPAIAPATKPWPG